MPLAIPALILAFVGLLISLVAGLWTLILAFQDHWGWGLAYLFVPFASLVFIILKWSKRAVRRSFFLGLGGTLLMFLGIGIAAPSLTEMAQELPTYESQEVYTPEASTPEVSTPDGAEPDGAEPSSSEDTGSISSDKATEVSTESVAPSSSKQEASKQYDYKQSMSLGYLAFKQQDYQTAMINFQRALAAHPGDKLAADAIQNTQKAIQQSRS